ncbi:MAG: (d)CMP kinase [Proteobacteria bacterium]|nr:(d)CMP kinase [Pseudomonadota bacterium]MBU1420196.1 (d)CMP kinase [Pseudomonadota bacterium]MBU1455525.1 (d)CMP kinase [Pseudomonadota bacterium]
MSHKQKIVTIDGPSGVGKSTISRRVAQALSFTYLDTGAMYRAVGLKFKEAGLDMADETALRKCLDSISLNLLPAGEGSENVGVILDGRDVSQEIRSSEMSMIASRVSAFPAVREKLTYMQQEIGKKGEIVAEGRDTGTVVFPRAAWKFFLDADPEVRMHRRAKQLRSKGESVDEEELLKMIIKRDRDDQARSIAPLCKAKDALIIDTGLMTIDEVTQTMLKVIRKELT